MLLTELSVFKMFIQFFGKAFLRILNSDIQLDLFFNLWRINSCVILPLLAIISLAKNIPLLIHSLKNKKINSNVINLFPHKKMLAMWDSMKECWPS
jgi:hypothetical protein